MKIHLLINFYNETYVCACARDPGACVTTVTLLMLLILKCRAISSS